MQEGGATQTIGALEVGNCNPIGLAEAIERIARLNIINYPGVRLATW